MFFLWKAEFYGAPTAFKCHEVPMDGHGQAAVYLAKHELAPDEEAMLIRDLEKKYPAPQIE